MTAVARVLLLTMVLLGAGVTLVAGSATACGWEDVGEVGPVSWHLGCIYQEACVDDVGCARVGEIP